MKNIARLLLITFLWTGVASYATPPNIIFLLADDQSSYSMGCYGNDDVQTPHLDTLSDDGVTFDRHYNTTAICMASRANIMTGMYEYKTGCNFQHGFGTQRDLMSSMWKKSYPVLLREHGYTTAFAGKFGFELRDTPTGPTIPIPAADFDSWAGVGGYGSYTTADNPALHPYTNQYPHSTLAYGAFGSDFITAAATNAKPFCLSISFKAPHRPTTADPRFDHLYAGKTFTKPFNYGRTNGLHFSEQSRSGRQYERFVSWGYESNYDAVMATYHQQVHGIDVAVGMIRDAVEQAGVADNTIIIYTSDNGFFCGSHGYGSKVLPYEESTRVPLIIYDPRHPNSGKKLRSASLTGNIDFAPTMLALAGIPIPDNMDGKNLMELYKDPASDIHNALSLINVWGDETPTHALAVVTKSMKYINWSFEGTNVLHGGHYTPAEELYHLVNDPDELTNLAIDPAHTNDLAMMRQVYDQQLAHWKAETVPYNGYQKYGTIFDRNVSWTIKETGPYPLTPVQLKLKMNPTEIEFNTNLDQEYQLYVKTNLTQQAWTPIGSAISSIGMPLVVKDTNTANQVFYRVVQTEIP